MIIKIKELFSIDQSAACTRNIFPGYDILYNDQSKRLCGKAGMSPSSHAVIPADTFKSWHCFTFPLSVSVPERGYISRMKGAALPPGGPIPRLKRRRALLRQLHSPQAFRSSKVKALLFITFTPSCLTRPSLSGSARRGVRPSLRGCREAHPPGTGAVPASVPKSLAC